MTIFEPSGRPNVASVVTVLTFSMEIFKKPHGKRYAFAYTDYIELRFSTLEPDLWKQWRQEHNFFHWTLKVSPQKKLVFSLHSLHQVKNPLPGMGSRSQVKGRKCCPDAPGLTKIVVRRARGLLCPGHKA